LQIASNLFDLEPMQAREIISTEVLGYARRKVRQTLKPSLPLYPCKPQNRERLEDNTESSTRRRVIYLLFAGYHNAECAPPVLEIGD
jgi:hypothetical protein